ncbi:MAG: ATP-binding protein, partial [Bacteroidota bacterium]
GSSIRGIFKEADQLWTGGYLDNAVFSTNDQTLKKNLPDNLMSFFKDHRGHLLMAMINKVILDYNPAEEKYISYKFEYKSPFNVIFQNTVTKTYWIGTATGLLRFDRSVGKIIPYPLLPGSEELDIRQGYQNAEGLWIVTNQGIFLMDADSEALVKHYTTTDGLPANNIYCMYEDDEGIYWLATKGDGLIRWDRSNNSFRQYTKNEGLSNNTIYAVYEDDYNTLWLPSNYGLMAFDKTNATTKVYLPQNGIAHEEFNYLSHFQDTDGTLYFGGLNGIIRFHPKDLRSEKATSLPLYITNVRTLKKDAETFSDNTTAYTRTKTITLHPEDRMLDVEFALLDYKNNTENQYAYKITGHQEQWIYTNNNKISIMNPPYGRYQLIIKGRGASGQWSENTLNVPLHIKAPFYRKWWFIAILVFATIAGILFTIRWRTQKLQKDRERLEGEVQKRTRKIAQDREVIEVQAEELKALDKAKSRFFANITHEFRTPLTLIMGPTEQLLKSELPKSARVKLQSMKRNSTQLLGLINELLDLSKLENNKMHVEMAHNDLVACTRELLLPFQPLLDKKALQLHFQCPFQQWEVRFDEDKWSKILNNLLSNAIKFTPQGGTITLSLQKQKTSGGDTIQLRVADTGIGIEPEKLSHIFDRFYQADASTTRMQEGSGIGLSLVKELAELQNGSIHVESTVEKGTVFTLILPLVGEVTAEVASSTEALAPIHVSVKTQPNPTTSQNGQEKAPAGTLEVLIIEDNADMRAYIRSCIDETTYHITEAADGAEGIEKARQLVPDLIISDVMMPGKDGFEVTHAIRGHVATSHIPLILLTAKASLESRLKGLERGADAYLTKPFSPEELVLRIQKLIELRQLLQQRYQNSEIPEENTTFKKEDAFIGQLRDYILENISEPDLNGERISSHFAMSRMQLHRKLKTLTDTPTGDFIRSVRLQTALQLLKAMVSSCAL